MLPIFYFHFAGYCFLLFRHPIAGMVSSVPFIWFLTDHPLMFWASISGTATALAATGKKWPSRHHALIMMGLVALYEWLDGPAYIYVILTTLMDVLVLEWPVAKRKTLWSAGVTILCTTFWYNAAKTQLQLMAAQGLFLTLFNVFYDDKK